MKISSRVWLWIFIIFLSAIYAFFAIVKHIRLETNIFDLGYYDQIIWQVAHGHGLFSSILEEHAWVDHISPTLFLAVPLYWLFDTPLVLLLLRPFIVCLGAYPLYRLALKKTKQDSTAIIIALGYLLFYGIQNALVYEFHPFVFAAPALGWLFWLYEAKKMRWFWLVFVLFLGLQENFFLLGAAFGVFLFVKYKDKIGIGIVISCLAILTVVLTIIIPSFGSQYYYLPRHLSDKSLQDLVALLYTPTSKIVVIFASFLAFGFLPIFSPAIFILLGEEFVGRFVLTSSVNRWVLGYQYNATLAPIMAFASIEAITHFLPKNQGFARVVIVIGTIGTLLLASPETKKIFDPGFYNFSHTQDVYSILAQIPADASVAATNNLGAHLAHRKGLQFLTNCRDNPTVWSGESKRCYAKTPDYIVADLSQGSGSNNYYPDYSREKLMDYLSIVQKEKSFTLIARSGDAYLLKKVN